MSLYLAIFEDDQERAGWVLGHYSDFGAFRDKVAEIADGGRYPILMSLPTATDSGASASWRN